MLALLCLTMLAVRAGETDTTGMLVTALLFFGFGGSSAVFLGQAAKLWGTSLSFHRVFDGMPALVLRLNRPDRESFGAFVDEMKARIERAQTRLPSGGLAAELNGLEELRTEGRLSDLEFRAAKARLLGLEPWQIE